MLEREFVTSQMPRNRSRHRRNSAVPNAAAARLRSDSGRDFWSRLGPLGRHWLINIALGIAIEALLFAGHTQHWGPVVAADDWAIDVVTRLRHVVCSGATDAEAGLVERALVCRPDGGAQPPVLVAVDNETWRSAAWGGGEPERAPRAQLASLIERLFELGARQVVLDVVVQDRRPGRAEMAVADQEDQAFADRLRALLKQPFFSGDRLLILVRTERRPLTDDAAAFLPELRSSRMVDPVVDASGGRIVVAAPYFVIAEDRVMRAWDLFRVVCERPRDGVTTRPANVAGRPFSDGEPGKEGPIGSVRIVESVQLAAEVHRRKTAGAPTLSPASGALLDVQTPESCEPFPPDRAAELPPATAHARACKLRHAVGAALHPGHEAADCPEGRAQDVEVTSQSARFWKSLPGAWPELPKHGAVGNRVIFGLASEDIDTISAGALLDGDAAPAQTYGGIVKGRTAVIGQVNDETADFYYTPLGRMPGAAVLVNAIDSMSRHGLLVELPGLAEWFQVMIIIVGVGYLFARFDSIVGTLLSTAVLLPVLGLASLVYFAHGGWLDFILPVLGIQLHRLIAVVIEWRNYRRLAALHGAHH